MLNARSGKKYETFVEREMLKGGAVIRESTVIILLEKKCENCQHFYITNILQSHSILVS